MKQQWGTPVCFAAELSIAITGRACVVCERHDFLDRIFVALPVEEDKAELLEEETPFAGGKTKECVV